MNGIINGTEVYFYPVDANVDTYRNCSRISFAKLAAMGGVYANFAETFRTVTTEFSFNGEGLYRAVTKSGGPLADAADGIGKRGMVRNAKGIEEQARFFDVGNITGTTKTVVPVNPAVTCICFAMIAMSEKLDDISNNQRTIINLIKDDKSSKIKGSLVTLNEILSDYSNEINNDRFKKLKMMKVLDIKNQAQQDMSFYSEQIEKLLKKAEESRTKKAIRKENASNNIFDELAFNLKYYKLSIYLYSFASMLEVMLIENLSSQSCSNSIERIENLCNDYRVLYSRCYEEMSDYMHRRLDNQAKIAAAQVVKGVGKAIRHVPVLEKGPVDEFPINTGGRIDDARIDYIQRTMNVLRMQKNNESGVFVNHIRLLDDMINNRAEIFIDKENLYLQTFPAV